MASTKLLTIYLAAGVITLVAWVLNTPRLYWMAGVMILLPLASRLLARAEQRGVEAARDFPAAGHQGDRVPVRLRLRNLSVLPKLHLSVGDDLPPGLRASGAGSMLPVHLSPFGSDEAQYELHLGRRGLHEVPAVRLESTDLLGLYTHQGRLPVSSRILVYPKIIDLPPSVLPPEIGGGSTPVTTSRRQGEGASFFGIREYRPGDPLRHVHWRSAARLGRLTVIEWEAEESLDVIVAVETRKGSDRSLGPDATTLDLAAGFAASLAAGILASGDSLRLLAPGYTERRHGGGSRGVERLPEILETLARVEALSETSAAAQLREMDRLMPGTLICWLTPDADENLLSTVRFLRAAGLTPVIYALADSPRGQPSAWDAVTAELERLGVWYLRLHPEDEVTRRLLS
jgi:uncharacterized protein (DUF58 family)